MKDSIAPLPISLWFSRIELIAEGGLSSLENALRHASHLLQLTPFEFRHVVHPSVSEEQFEALLSAGDLDTAARHLIAQPAALRVDESDPSGRVAASISCSILGRVIHGTGTCIASAVLNAWTTCLLALKTETDPGNVRSFSAGSGLRRQSTPALH
jgi:hypothetical protein